MKTPFEAVKSKALEYGFEVEMRGTDIGVKSTPVQVGKIEGHYVVFVGNGGMFGSFDMAIGHLGSLLSQYALKRDLSAQTGKVLDSPTNTPKVAHRVNGGELEGFMSVRHNHYYKNVENLSEIDIYRVLDLFDVHSHALGHAVKKIMCAGGRGVKDHDKDIQEAIETLVRYQQMRAEDSLGAKK